MPIYEFFCDRCRTVFNFYSRRINTNARPDCPRCRAPEMKRSVSRFATPSGRDDVSADSDADMPESPQEARMAQAMERLAGEAESLSEDDPRQAAALMRRFSSLSGMPLSDGMQEALQRLEKGEDPERIEEEMGDVLENEDPFDADIDAGAGDDTPKAHHPKTVRPIRHDDTLYEFA